MVLAMNASAQARNISKPIADPIIYICNRCFGKYFRPNLSPSIVLRRLVEKTGPFLVVVLSGLITFTWSCRVNYSMLMTWY